jgi:hypothetical protein
MAMDKGELKTRIVERMHRLDMTDDLLNEFIDDGMEVLAQAMRVSENEQTASYDASVSTSLPDDFRMMRQVTRAEGAGTLQLKPISPIAAQRWSASGSGSLGYVIKDGILTLYPASDEIHTLEYWAAGSDLLVDASSNVFTNNYAAISMYSALVEAAIWSQDLEHSQGYQNRLLGLIQNANRAGRDARMPVGSSVGSATISGSSPVRTL